MTTLSRRDQLLLWGLAPLFAVCVFLHVQEVARSGLAQLPVWVVPSWDASNYPRVGGYRVETDSSGSGLLPGDRVLRVGDRDLRGVGNIGFDAIALAQTGAAGTAPIVYERNGQRHEGTIRPRPHPDPWSRVPLLVGCLVLTGLILLRAPSRADARRFYAAFVVYGIAQAQFYGGPEWKTWLSLGIWNVGTSIAVFLMLRWAALFPSEVPERHRSWWGWAAAGTALWLCVRASYLVGGPIPPPLVPRVAQATHAGLMLLTIGLLARNYAQAGALGRRQLKWVLYGATMGSIPLAAAQLTLAVRPAWSHFPLAYAGGTMATALWVVFTIVAIVRYSAFDIDRLLSATASASLMAAVFVAGVVFVLPELASALSGPDLGESTVRVGLALVLVAVLAAAHGHLRPWLDRMLFPGRLVQGQEIEQLLRDLSQCTSASEIWQLVGERLDGILRPERCRIYAARGERFEAVWPPGEEAAPDFAARGPLMFALARRPAPLAVDSGEFTAMVPDCRAEEHAVLEAAGARILLPLRCGKDLAALTILGARRSGDVYTSSELTLLGAVGEKASAMLLHLRDAEVIRSERVRSEELARLKADADEAHRRRSRFLAAASHDLRQPLHALGMYASLMRERAHASEVGELADRIQRSTATLGEMFSSLLDLSRLDVGAVEPRVSGFALDPLLEDVCAEAAPSAEAKGLKLLWVPCGLAVQSDPMLLGRILRNLVGNAVRYTGEGEIRVTAPRLGTRVCIEIADTGPGIPAERQPEIFREFVRLGGDRSPRGLGLGLAIVERLAAVLAHQVDLDSEPGRGSTFRVTVPLARAPLADSEAPGAAGLAGRVVVLIDDDLDVLRATRDVLASWGCHVVAATSSDEALTALENRGLVPHAILSDYRLDGGATGLDAIAALRAAFGREVPGAVLTGESTEAVQERIRAQGLPQLTKPAPLGRLRALVTELVRR
jgi:signal transduction histidine kinase/CheY-like chemotaxis protein